MLRFAALLLAMAPVAVEPTVTIPLNGHKFTLPAGFTIELAAGPPLVDRPVTVAFDEIGRLYVADSSGSNEKLSIQLEKKPHRIVRLDPAKDGVFTTGHVYADKIMFPEGTMWYRGSLYVAGPPSIWKLTDTTGNGIADQRSEWYQGKTLGNCGNDLHGPWLGPDGWFYWTKGGFQPQKHVFFGKEIETRASILFRAKPDGSQREPIMVGGMDNPVGLAFTPGGEPILTNTFLVYPSNGQRDGLIHAVYGGVYGKDFADVLAPHIRTSTKLMPVLEHLGPAAPTGIVRYDSDVFGPEYRDNMFVGQFNLRKVSRHILTPKGATFESKTSDFVVSDNHDFHPTDVVMDADGSLLIVDTGGWYKLCCPTSQLVKPDVLGAIYRVRKVGAKGPDDPRGLKVEWKKATEMDLAELLSDRRPAVRTRAKQGLSDRGVESIYPLELVLEYRDARAQTEALWALAQIEGSRAAEAAGGAIRSKDAAVRHAALFSLSRKRNGFGAACYGILRDEKSDPQDLRLAWEIVDREWPDVLRRDAGRTGEHSSEMVATIVLGQATIRVAKSDDRFLKHSYLLAALTMQEQRKRELKSTDADESSVPLLNELYRGRPIRRETILAALGSSDPGIRDSAWFCVPRIPKGASILAEFVRKLPIDRLTAEERSRVTAHLARMASAPEVRDLLAEMTNEAVPVAALAFAAISQSNPKNVPGVWQTAIISALDRPDRAGPAISAARRLKLPSSPRLVRNLEEIAEGPAQSLRVRLEALAAMPPNVHQLSAGSFALVRSQLEADRSSDSRSLAVDALSRSKLTADQLAVISDMISKAGPLEVDRLLELFAGQKDDAVGARLMDALEQPKLAGSLRVDSLERRLKNFGPPVQQRAAKLYARLNANLAGQRSHLEELLVQLPAGDVRRGQAVFNRAKSVCAACHTIGYVGGKTGPDLTRIGSIRTKRDLLEAVVFPSASFVRGYEPVVIVTTDGKTHNGLVRTENADEITLTTGPSQEERILRKEIESIEPSRVSVMPAGLEQQMSALDLADLVAFLRACR